MIRIQRMSADSAKAIIEGIQGNLANISIKSLDGLTPTEATALENLYYQSCYAHGAIIEGKPLLPLRLPAEDIDAKNQSDWEGQQLAQQLKTNWHDTAMVVGQPQPETVRGVSIE
jgi:hypothetical protein